MKIYNEYKLGQYTVKTSDKMLVGFNENKNILIFVSHTTYEDNVDDFELNCVVELNHNKLILKNRFNITVAFEENTLILNHYCDSELTTKEGAENIELH